MIKKFTFLLFAAAAMAAGANADDNLTFNWAHSVDGTTTSGDQVIGVAKGADGNYFVLNAFGTNSDTGDMNVNFDGEALLDHTGNNPVEGSPYKGNSMNANLLLQSVDSVTGDVKWFAYTKKGYVYENSSQISSAPDGGLVMVLKCRAWVEEAGLNNLLELIDAKGHSTTINDPYTQESEYRYLVIKMSGEGVLEWSRVIAGKVVLAGEKIDENYESALKRDAKDVITVYSSEVDDVGNIYLAGNFRTSIYFKKKDGSVVTFAAKNNQSYTGDSQEVMGDLFLVKLDKDGYYENSLLAEGTAALAFLDNVVYNDGKVYLNGRTKSDGTTLTIGGKEITASETYQTMFMVSVNTADMSVNWVSPLTSSKGTKASTVVIQNKSSQFINGSVYFTGLLRGAWIKAGETEPFIDSKANTLKGYVLKINPETGEVQNYYISDATSISGYWGVYVGENNTYAFGYNFGGGAILTKIANDTYTKVSETAVCTYGTVAALTTPLIDGENFVMQNRGGAGSGSSASASFYNTDKNFPNLVGWGTVYYSYKINDAAAAE